MLKRVAEGVWVHTAECIETNATVVRGAEGALVVDPGLTRAELACLARDLDDLALPVVAGFATHPDWDHVLWDAAFGDAPRYATARAEASLRALLAEPDWVEQVAEGLPEEIADDVPMELFGQVTALPAGTLEVPWDGPAVRILEHSGHAPGHAALLVGRTLVAGDMLSDVLVPMIGVHGNAEDPIGDYLAGLDVLEAVAGEVDAVIPGHGSVGDAAALRSRLAADRAYVEALRDGRDVVDGRIGPDAKPGWEWVAFVHDGQVEGLAARG